MSLLPTEFLKHIYDECVYLEKESAEISGMESQAWLFQEYLFGGKWISKDDKRVAQIR